MQTAIMGIVPTSEDFTVAQKLFHSAHDIGDHEWVCARCRRIIEAWYGRYRTSAALIAWAHEMWDDLELDVA
jgi:hypothetical protein